MGTPAVHWAIPRFLSYTFQEQAGDVLILVDSIGQERQLGFRILDVSLPGQSSLYFVLPTSGAWLALDEHGEYRPLTVMPQENEVDALTVFLSFLRRSGPLFDQSDHLAKSA